jgi:hypothetical protein
MTFREKYDKTVTGIVGGLILPLIVVLFVFLFAKDHPPLSAWINRIDQANILTHIISLCVFPNVIIFLIFNHFDMLRASRGVLAITIIWAVLVFCIRFLL